MGKAENPRAVQGDNSAMPGQGEVEEAVGVAAGEIRAFIERIERVEEDERGLRADKKDIFAEARGRGFDTKAIRAILRARKQDRDEREEHQAIVQLYADALGMGDIFA